ncbi:MAG TPA: Fe-S protein assembly co-chaperone HscB [Bryobacteraceae bacterium]|nr:Fe-S protein assembly co-chaperone HscB [Bryobacteraceae bacterium]
MNPVLSNYYDFFGLEHNLDLDLADLEKRFYALSRQYHPDRYTLKSREEQQYALDATAVLNDAYRTLRDPLARAEYLLKENGFDIGEQGSKNVPPELLEEVFELNMALEELRGGDDSARPALEEARNKFVAMREEIDSELQSRFAAYDRTRDHEVLADIRGILNRRRYIRNLVNEVEKELAGAAA